MIIRDFMSSDDYKVISQRDMRDPEQFAEALRLLLAEEGLRISTESAVQVASNMLFYMTQSVTVGKYDIAESCGGDPKKIWIGLAGDGEGGDFDVEKLEAVIDEFYQKHF